jgi:hypothetical protein
MNCHGHEFLSTMVETLIDMKYLVQVFMSRHVILTFLSVKMSTSFQSPNSVSWSIISPYLVGTLIHVRKAEQTEKVCSSFRAFRAMTDKKTKTVIVSL